MTIISPQPTDHLRRVLRAFLLAASITTFLSIAAGNIVRASGAGLGCPDWPTCYGQWGFPTFVSAQIQYAHRFLALFSGMLVLISAGLVMWGRPALRSVRVGMLAAVTLVGMESFLGGQVVLQKTPSLLNALHMAVALALFAMVLSCTVIVLSYRKEALTNPKFQFNTTFGRWTLAALGIFFLVTVSGIYLANSSQASLCTTWPLCGTRLLPLTSTGWLEVAHRLLTLGASIIVLWLLVSAWRGQIHHTLVLSATTATAWLFFGQVLVGILKVSQVYRSGLVGLHAVSAAGLWAALVVLVVAAGLAGRSPSIEAEQPRLPRDMRQRFLDLLILTKPVIVLLLLVTTYAGMVVGRQGFPPLSLTIWTLVGGALAAGGSSAINQYIDRDLDRNMQRTARRPLAARRMTPAEGLAYGIGLCLAAFFILAGFVNLLAAVLSAVGMVYYVLIYSVLLKRVTVQNIVIGGGAGAIPPMVGWAAATGSLAIPSLFMFAIVFLWTPPHFWALALVRRKDYERAGVPMLPVVKGEQFTRQQIVIYTLELVGLTLCMPLFHMAGSLFLVSAVTLGGGMVYAAVRVLRYGGNKNAYRLYRFSSLYLMFIFAALVIDAVVKI